MKFFRIFLEIIVLYFRDRIWPPSRRSCQKKNWHWRVKNVKFSHNESFSSSIFFSKIKSYFLTAVTLFLRKI